MHATTATVAKTTGNLADIAGCGCGIIRRKERGCWSSDRGEKVNWTSSRSHSTHSLSGRSRNEGGLSAGRVGASASRKCVVAGVAGAAATRERARHDGPGSNRRAAVEQYSRPHLSGWDGPGTLHVAQLLCVPKVVLLHGPRRVREKMEEEGMKETGGFSHLRLPATAQEVDHGGIRPFSMRTLSSRESRGIIIDRSRAESRAGRGRAGRRRVLPGSQQMSGQTLSRLCAAPPNGASAWPSNAPSAASGLRRAITHGPGGVFVACRRRNPSTSRATRRVRSSSLFFLFQMSRSMTA